MSAIDILNQWMNVHKRVMAQITSGRWIITVAATYCLIKLTNTLCCLMEQGEIVLEAATYVAIIMAVLNTVGMIVTFYFQKPRIAEDNDKENGEEGITTTTTTLMPKK